MDYFLDKIFVGASYSYAECIFKQVKVWETCHRSIHRNEEFVVNTEACVGLILRGSWFAVHSNRTTQHREYSACVPSGSDGDVRGYYTTSSVMKKLISKFFTRYPTYKLIVDVSTQEHQCCLYITLKKKFRLG